MPRRTERNIRGKPTTAEAKTAPFQSKARWRSKNASTGPNRPRAAKEQQEQIAGDYWRQDQRQVTEAVERDLERKFPPAQQPAQQHGRQQAQQHTAKGHAQREQQDLHFLSAEHVDSPQKVKPCLRKMLAAVSELKNANKSRTFALARPLTMAAG